MLKAIAYFIRNNTSLVLGTDLFYGFRPQDAPDRCQVLSETVGGSTDEYLRDRVDKRVQIVSRAKTYGRARTDAHTIYNFLHGRIGDVLPVVVSGEAYQANVIQADTDPQYIGTDSRGRHEFSTNYTFKIQDAS